VLEWPPVANEGEVDLMAGAFDATVRVLLCANCGAALPPAPTEGGQVQCQYCRSVSIVAARDDGALSQRGPVDEAQRQANLWSQIHNGMQIHAEVAAVTENNVLPEKNADAALKLWAKVRETQAVDPVAVGDDLLFLTGALAGYYALKDDTVAVRAVWESALESCHEPRHRQFIRCSLSRLAARAGDLAAASEWLRPCDPQSDDLLCDTSYRLSYSYLATVQSNFDGVVQALGRTTDALPLFFANKMLCHVLRANAIEKLGDVTTATEQVKSLVAADPTMSAILPMMAKANANLNLCPQSIPAALGR
jgi:DNA-directed RNA polymerase subunit RPC12/RpoP